MDGNGNMNMRNWGFYESTNEFRGHLGLHLMPSIADVKPLLGGREHHHPGVIQGNSFHHQPPIHIDYMRGTWINQRDNKYLDILPGTHHHHPHYNVTQETSTSPPLQILQHLPSPKNEGDVSPIEDNDPNKDKDGESPLKKRKTQKSLKPKKPKRSPKNGNDSNGTPEIRRARAPRRSAEVCVNGIDMDMYGIAIPVCSCTGTRHQCYRWGSSGWQSACCTTSMSIYPLPMSTKRRSGRIAGRKMSLGAFKKVLEKLASESYNFSDPIDLKTRWARHGTNKFVTIR